MENILSVKNVCKDEILNDISFDVKKGEMTAIMGPSGSGKSTLLYGISGMDNVTSGDVVLSGEYITQMNEDERASLRLNKMGFVFQQMNMMKNLTIFENVVLPAFKKSRNEKEETDAYAESLMAKMGISDLKDRRINEVSGGQLQRACICRSMINHPEILFADEPTGALNQNATKEVMDELQKLNLEGMTILMVTHDSKVASRCDRVLYILDGKIEGELNLGKWDKDSEKQKEAEVSKWLGEMGW